MVDAAQQKSSLCSTVLTQYIPLKTPKMVKNRHRSTNRFTFRNNEHTFKNLTGSTMLSFSHVLRGGMSAGAPDQYAFGDWKVCFTENGSTLKPTTLDGGC